MIIWLILYLFIGMISAACMAYAGKSSGLDKGHSLLGAFGAIFFWPVFLILGVLSHIYERGDYK